MRRTMSGFTLLELMFVLAVISVIAVLAIPMYQSYQLRAQVSEGLNMAASLKQAVGETYLVNGSFPTSNVAAGVKAPAEYQTAYVDNITVIGAPPGGIQVTYRVPQIAGKTLILQPLAAGGSFEWSCLGGTLDAQYRPQVCRP